MLKVTAWPGLSVTGGFTPVTRKTPALLAICDIVTAAPPLLVKVSESTLLLAVGTVPNCRLAALGCRVPVAAALPLLEEPELKLHPVPATSGNAATSKSNSRTGDRRAVISKIINPPATVL
jgi:hypothetical protein